MDKINAYVRLHLRLMRTKSSANRKSRIASTLLMIVTVVVMLFLFYYFLVMVNDQFGKHIDIADFSTLLLTIIEIVLTIACISYEIKGLLKPSDLKIVARFPMSSFQTFVAELIIVFTRMLIMSVTLFVPIMLVFGFAIEQLSVIYVLRVLLASLFAVFLPFGLGTLLTVPVMYAKSAIQNKNILKLILFVLLLSGALFLYDYILNLLAEYFIHQRISSETISVMSKFVTVLNVWANPSVLLKNIAVKGNWWLSAIILLGLGIGFFAFGLLLAKPVYNKVRLYELEGKAKLFGLKTKYTSNGPFMAIFKKEFKDIIRTGTFAYYYLGVAITTPVMVFFCNRLVNKVGEAQVGGNVAYGVSVLVLLSFMAMINSFSAQAISREKETFYITKMTPYTFKAQLVAKAVINFIVALGALSISIFVIARLDFLSIGKSFLVFGISFVSAIGMIINGFNLNLANPDLASSTNRDAGQTNMNLLMLIGLLYAILQGGLAIILDYLGDSSTVYIINIALTVVYSAVNIVVFLLTAEKRYTNIEFK